MECYNVIYNSRPLYLFSAAEELKKNGIRRFRLSFTVEEEGQVRDILEVLAASKNGSLPASDMEHYTYGHYRRGVE
jgi:putative protease